jgi:hypothetical protein
MRSSVPLLPQVHERYCTCRIEAQAQIARSGARQPQIGKKLLNDANSLQMCPRCIGDIKTVHKAATKMGLHILMLASL